MRKTTFRALIGCAAVLALAAASGATYVGTSHGYLGIAPSTNPVGVEQGVSQISAYLAMTDADAFDEPLDLQSANGGVTPLAKVWSLKADGRVSVVVQQASHDLCLGIAKAKFTEAESVFVNSGQSAKPEACMPDRVLVGNPVQSNVVVILLRRDASPGSPSASGFRERRALQ